MRFLTDLIIEQWIWELNLMEWDVTTEAIDDARVMYAEDCVGDERYFIGISKDEATHQAVIHHMRPLIEEDIIHELLHLANPEKSEEWVVSETNRLYIRNK